MASGRCAIGLLAAALAGAVAGWWLEARASGQLEGSLSARLARSIQERDAAWEDAVALALQAESAAAARDSALRAYARNLTRDSQRGIQDAATQAARVARVDIAPKLGTSLDGLDSDSTCRIQLSCADAIALVVSDSMRKAFRDSVQVGRTVDSAITKAAIAESRFSVDSAVALTQSVTDKAHSRRRIVLWVAAGVATFEAILIAVFAVVH